MQRKILDEVGCSHQSLASFFGIDQVNRDGIARLLEAMKRHSKPVAPQHLGIIGAEHFKAAVRSPPAAPLDTFKYQIRKGITDGIPYVIEFAFGLHQAGLDGAPPSPANSSPVPTGAPRSATRSAGSETRERGWRAPWPRCAPTPSSR